MTRWVYVFCSRRPGDFTAALAGNTNRVALPTSDAAVGSWCFAPGCTLTRTSAAATAANEGYPNGQENEFAGNYCRVEHGSMAAFRRRFDDFIAFVAKKTQGALKNVYLLWEYFPKCQVWAIDGMVRGLDSAPGSNLQRARGNGEFT